MASHSENTFYVRGSILGDHSPVDTGSSRDAVVENANHLLDESPLVFVDWCDEAGEYRELVDPSTTELRPIDLLPTFWFPLPIKPSSGDTVLVVPYLQGSVSSAATATFQVRLWFAHDPAIGFGTAGTDIVTIASGTTTSTAAGGAVVTLSPSTIYIPAAAIEASSSAWAEFESSDAAGDPATGRVLLAALHITAKTTQAGSKPRVHGFRARGYIGS